MNEPFYFSQVAQNNNQPVRVHKLVNPTHWFCAQRHHERLQESSSGVALELLNNRSDIFLLTFIVLFLKLKAVNEDKSECCLPIRASGFDIEAISLSLPSLSFHSFYLHLYSSHPFGGS
jgi:hypothetical protein